MKDAEWEGVRCPTALHPQGGLRADWAQDCMWPRVPQGGLQKLYACRMVGIPPWG